MSVSELEICGGDASGKFRRADFGDRVTTAVSNAARLRARIRIETDPLTPGIVSNLLKLDWALLAHRFARNFPADDDLYCIFVEE